MQLQQHAKIALVFSIGILDKVTQIFKTHFFGSRWFFLFASSRALRIKADFIGVEINCVSGFFIQVGLVDAAVEKPQMGRRSVGVAENNPPRRIFLPFHHPIL